MLFIIIGTIYISPTNLDYIPLAIIKYALCSYRGRLNTSKLYYKVTLSLIRLSSTLELIKYLALLLRTLLTKCHNYLERSLRSW